MKRKMNKKGVIFPLIAMLGLVILSVYLILFLPFPKLAKVKSLVHYVLIILVWFLFQVGLIYGYFKLSDYAQKGLNLYRNKIRNWTIKIKYFLVSQK
jgi:hypothetical protein